MLEDQPFIDDFPSSIDTVCPIGMFARCRAGPDVGDGTAYFSGTISRGRVWYYGDGIFQVVVRTVFFWPDYMHSWIPLNQEQVHLDGVWCICGPNIWCFLHFSMNTEAEWAIPGTTAILDVRLVPASHQCLEVSWVIGVPQLAGWFYFMIVHTILKWILWLGVALWLRKPLYHPISSHIIP